VKAVAIKSCNRISACEKSFNVKIQLDFSQFNSRGKSEGFEEGTNAYEYMWI